MAIYEVDVSYIINLQGTMATTKDVPRDELIKMIEAHWGVSVDADDEFSDERIRDSGGEFMWGTASICKVGD